ncbi:substrate-binding domain-containing protein [uncultured Paracoccus sp.]|uniref:substrate-binding domain-containing protein n=1 Tax=uncultured Paracoccus sp. TaxID=189685 RepID=UPI0025F32FA2|nr:substrate-binding domain-containing protein [uncultured Paracoccus sp.]
MTTDGHGRRPPRMADLAKAVGVSTMTVSRAFRGKAGINPETRARILRKAEELGYVFDATAASLRQSRSGFVAVTVPSINNANFAETVRQLSGELSQNGLQILLANTEYDPLEEERLIGELLRRKPEAIVLTVGQYTRRTRQILRATAIPVIEIWDLPAEPIQHVIGFSNAKCTGRLVDHLVAQGCRGIAFVGGDSPHDPRGGQRREGFIAAMRRHGLDGSALVPTGPAPVGMAEGADALDRLLALRPTVQAVVCVSDLVAFGLLSACQRRGIAVPGQLAVAGFGNYDIARICVPRLTTTDAHAGRIGSMAAGLILRLLKGEAPETPVRFDVGAELILRESTR